MALYHHVDGKDALVALVIDKAMSEHPLPDRTEAGWREDLWELARWMRARLQVHPAISELRRRFQVWSPAMYSVGERWTAIWQDSGLTPEATQRAATESGMAVLGVLEERLQQQVRPPEGALLASFPNLRANSLTPRERDDDFELLVRSLVDGLHIHLSGS
jgi:AcrR family transcriptional regulator